jgi:predicted DNA-binding protein with PD1-like motif
VVLVRLNTDGDIAQALSAAAAQQQIRNAAIVGAIGGHLKDGCQRWRSA